MVTDQQVRLMMKLSKTEKTLSLAAAKAGMDEKTARKYHRLRRLPSEVQVEHAWQTRDDPQPTPLASFRGSYRNE